ncbi:protein phosphatase 1D [Nephila pilipes]|uniref:Protein phosphatase 1D n=1 Tax=Nephila pilipes TaxID=299642 RepID=A0A8X6UI47_NEPPI|nr:protein phosphatase 1D [Nephila pilipes]
MSTSEINLRVTGQSSQGGRRYMEDAFVVAYQQTEDKKDLEYAFFGIFDGHGGREAAQYAKNNLLDNIVTLKQFWQDDDDMVLSAIRDGFLNTHLAMWKEVENWPKTASGLPSTAGTTASVAFIRKGKLYTGHVGDSRIVIGLKEQGSEEWEAESLTVDHKPECPQEKQRILESGGLVMNKSGVERVVWKRPRPGHEGPILRSTDFEKIPFLAVARSLGDLWSYDYFQQEFAVSPEPDLGVMSLDLNKDKCLILASDGLWNIMSPQSAVHLVQDVENENRKLVSKFGISENIHLTLCNPSRVLVDCGLERWNQLRTRADNLSVITVMLDPSEVGVLKEQLVLKMNYPRSLPVWDVGLRCKNFDDLLEAHGVKNKMGYLRLVPRSTSLTKSESLPNCFVERGCESDEGGPLHSCSNFLPEHSATSKASRKMEAEGIENSPCLFPRWSKSATGRTSLSKLATWSKVVSRRRMSDPFPHLEMNPLSSEVCSLSDTESGNSDDSLQEMGLEPDLCDKPSYDQQNLKVCLNHLSNIKQAIKRKYPGAEISQSFIGVEKCENSISQKKKLASSLIKMSNGIQS